MIFICIAVVIALIVVFVGAPLRRAREDTVSHEPSAGGWSAAHGEDLETAREAKYREIRDAELDFRTGKLSEQDYSRIDAELRAEALEILDALESSTPQGARSTPETLQGPIEPA